MPSLRSTSTISFIAGLSVMSISGSCTFCTSISSTFRLSPPTSAPILPAAANRAHPSTTIRSSCALTSISPPNMSSPYALHSVASLRNGLVVRTSWSYTSQGHRKDPTSCSADPGCRKTRCSLPPPRAPLAKSRSSLASPSVSTAPPCVAAYLMLRRSTRTSWAGASAATMAQRSTFPRPPFRSTAGPSPNPAWARAPSSWETDRCISRREAKERPSPSHRRRRGPSPARAA
mmetsp:Transcript_6850/g.14783  ORF Transcript_6850/g.14783 Transcript_6850/m.14783 type:complete len:232 (+) Transcript_6850:135-830(+)